jgi:hypothetical protein
MADYGYLQHLMEENDRLRKELDSMRVAYDQAVATINQFLESTRNGSVEADGMVARKEQVFPISRSMLEEHGRVIDLLRAQIALLLPWARLGARSGVTDSTWDDAQRLLDRIASGEFGEIR